MVHKAILIDVSIDANKIIQTFEPKCNKDLITEPMEFIWRKVTCPDCLKLFHYKNFKIIKERNK